MELDIRKITEELITELLVESENLKQQAEGARRLFVRIVQESEKLNGRVEESPVVGTEANPEEQSN